MHRLTRVLALAAVVSTMALAAPASAGELSVSIVGDGYIVQPGPNAEVIYYGPQDYALPPVVPGYPGYGAGYGYGYGYPPPPVAYYPPPAYGYYGAPGSYAGGYGWPYGRRALRLR